MSATIASKISVSPTRQALLDALHSWCRCEFDAYGDLAWTCPGHVSLGQTLFVVHMEFGRYLAARLRQEEGLS